MGVWTPVEGPTAGDDIFVGDDSDENVDALGGNDGLDGGGGNDILAGGAGDDIITWTLGSDTLLGGDDNDTFILSGGVVVGVLTIDGGNGADTVHVTDARGIAGSTMSGVETLIIGGPTFGTLTLANQNFISGITTLGIRGAIELLNPGVIDLTNVAIPNTFVIDGVTYNAQLSFAGTDVGANTFIMAATSTVAANIHGNEFNDNLTGGAGGDSLNGFAGDDVLNGGAGNDFIDPGGGTDTVFGGAGFDIIDRTFGGDTGVLIADGGDDFDVLKLDGGVISPGSSFTNIEILYIDDFFNPTTIDPALLSGFQALWGGGGRIIFANPGTVDLSNTLLLDVFVYQFHTHTNTQFSLTGSSGDDTLILPEYSGARVYMWGEGGNDTMLGSGFDDNFWGNAGDDILRGYGGNDSLFWDGGNDILDGGDGADDLHLFGASGSVAVDGGAGNDVVTVWGASMSAGSSIVGVELFMLIRGNGPPNGVLSSGQLSFAPGALPTTGVLGSNNGLLVVLSGGITDLSNVTMSATFDQPGGFTYNNVWRFQGSSDADTLLFPEPGRAPLTASGGAGADTLRGGAVNDILDGGADNDALIGGQGRDIAVYSGIVSTSASWHRNPDGSWTVGAGASGTDTVTSVEFLDFTDRDVFLDRAYSTFSGDGTSDVFMRHSTGAMGVWFVGASGVTAAAGLGAIDPAWAIEGVGDFNGDSRDDIFMRNANGNIGTWFMNGASASGAAGLGNIDLSWDIAGFGDLNGDGFDDIVMWNANGSLGVWFMNNGAVSGAAGLGNISHATFAFEGLGDFNGDGRDDILWRNSAGDAGIWFMNGGAATGAGIGNIPTNWTIEGIGDFNGDGRDDILMRDASGNLGVWFMSGASATGAGLGNVSQSFAVAAVGDYNGDGRDDILWWNDNGSLGAWFMNGASASGAVGYGAVSHDWIINPGG